MGILTRREDWVERFNAVLADMQGKPSAMGEFDCAIFAGRVVEALTGEDRYQCVAGYKTKRQALTKIAEIAPSFAEAVSKVLEVQPMSPFAARRGDLVMMRDEIGQDHLGVVTGAMALFLAEKGFVSVPIDSKSVLFAWRVG